MQTNELILYTTAVGNVKIEVTYANDNFWLSRKVMSLLFRVEVPAIRKQLANIYIINELSKEATISKMEIVQKEGKRFVKRVVEFYLSLRGTRNNTKSINKIPLNTFLPFSSSPNIPLMQYGTHFRLS